MKIRKILSVFLSSVTLLSLLAFASCSKPDDPNAETTAAADVETGEQTTGALVDEWGREIVEDGLPADLSFKGKKLTFYSREDPTNRWGIDYYAEESNGMAVNDAVFKRNADIMERLGIEIDIIEAPGSYSQFTDYSNRITNAYNSGTHQFDIVATYSLYGAQYATKGYFKNVLDMSEYLDLDKIWWNQALKDDLTIANRLFFTVGDMNLTTLTRMFVIFFNKTLVGEMHPDVDLYNEVIDGKWTIEYLTDFVSDAYSDLNGNSQADSSDRYGIVTISPSEAYDSLAAALDVHLMEKNNDGNWVMTSNTEHIVTAVERAAKLYFTNNSSYFSSIENTLNHFTSDRAQFMLITLDKTGEEPLSSMASPYGVLPLPKLDEEQKMYYTIPQDAFNLTSVMVDTQNPDLCAAVLTLMSATNYRDIVPLYYEEVLKFRYMHDSTSGRMLDYLREGLRFDFATINTLSVSDAGHWFRNVLDANHGTAGNTAAGSLRAMKKGFEKGLADLIAAYEGISEQ